MLRANWPLLWRSALTSPVESESVCRRRRLWRVVHEGRIDAGGARVQARAKFNNNLSCYFAVGPPQPLALASQQLRESSMWGAGRGVGDHHCKAARERSQMKWNEKYHFPRGELRTVRLGQILAELRPSQVRVVLGGCKSDSLPLYRPLGTRKWKQEFCASFSAHKPMPLVQPPPILVREEAAAHCCARSRPGPATNPDASQRPSLAAAT